MHAKGSPGPPLSPASTTQMDGSTARYSSPLPQDPTARSHTASAAAASSYPTYPSTPVQAVTPHTTEYSSPSPSQGTPQRSPLPVPTDQRGAAMFHSSGDVPTQSAGAPEVGHSSSQMPTSHASQPAEPSSSSSKGFLPEAPVEMPGPPAYTD